MSSPARRAARALGTGTLAVGGWLVALADPAPRRPARLGPPRPPCAPVEDLAAPRAAVSVAAAALLVLG